MGDFPAKPRIFSIQVPSIFKFHYNSLQLQKTGRFNQIANASPVTNPASLRIQFFQVYFLNPSDYLLIFKLILLIK